VLALLDREAKVSGTSLHVDSWQLPKQLVSVVPDSPISLKLGSCFSWVHWSSTYPFRVVFTSGGTFVTPDLTRCLARVVNPCYVCCRDAYFGDILAVCKQQGFMHNMAPAMQPEIWQWQQDSSMHMPSSNTPTREAATVAARGIHGQECLV
jgi:hypothetical protein